MKKTLVSSKESDSKESTQHHTHPKSYYSSMADLVPLVATVLRDIFSHAKKLVILNVACYEANALLPNGENAHITVRSPHWWKGALDLISVEYPSVSIDLICSPKYNQMQAFPTFSDEQRQADDKFCVAY